MLDIEKALEAAEGKNPKTNDSTATIDFDDTTDAVKVWRESSSGERFPLVLGIVLIIIVIFFTAFALLTVCKQRKEDKKQDDSQDTDSTLATKERKSQYDERNSWVLGSFPESSLHLAEEGNSQCIARDDIDREEGAILSWKDLSCTYPAKTSHCKDITTLKKVTGHIKTKELVAIMGQSGSGKTTMMDILSGRKSLGKLGGELSILGESMTSNSTKCRSILREVAAYVPQQIDFFPNQSPLEAVAFAANLKLGKDERGDDMRNKRVHQILDLVGIPEEARKRAIGGTLAGGMVVSGLSGGERKRLALACAVAMRPSLLFLDEVTSGLDSENAVIVVDLVKKLCINMNVAAVVIIHQPNFEVFSRFDRLILLSEGRCLYADKLSNISSFYEQIGRSMPDSYFVPSDILKVAGKINLDSNKSSYGLGSEPYCLVKTCGSMILKGIKVRKRPSALLQFKTVLLRQMMCHYVRNLTNLLARVLMYALTSLLFGCVFWKIGEIEDGQSSLSIAQAQATFGAGIFLTQGLYLIPFCQVSTFFFDKRIFSSESTMNLYPAWIYSLSQVVLELWVMVLCALTMAAIAVPMTSLWNPSYTRLHSFINMFTVFCVGGVAGNSIAMLISIMMFSQDLAFLVGAGFIVICLALSGGFVPYPFIEDWIVWMQWISPIKYSFQAYAWSLLSGTSTEGILAIMELDTPAGASSNICVLIGFFILCSTCSAFALSRKREIR